MDVRSVDKYVKDGVEVIIYDNLGWGVDRDFDYKVKVSKVKSVWILMLV